MYNARLVGMLNYLSIAVKTFQCCVFSVLHNDDSELLLPLRISYFYSVLLFTLFSTFLKVLESQRTALWDF